MADFTNAAQFVGRPQVQLEDPMQAQMKAASLAQAMQQQQLGALQLQKAQIDLKDQQVLRDAGKGLDWGDPASLNKLLANASSMGASPLALSQLQQHIADAKKKAADTDLAVLKLDTEKKDQFAGQLRALQQRPDWGSPESQSIYGNLANRAVANGWLTKEQVPSFPASPTALEPFINGLKLDSAIAKEAAEKAQTKSALTKTIGKSIYDISGEKPVAIATGPETNIAQAKEDLKNGRITQNEYNALIRKETAIPFTSISPLGGGGGIGGGGVAGGGAGGGTTGAQRTQQDVNALLQKIPKEFRSTIEKLGNYQILLSDLPSRPAPGVMSKQQAIAYLSDVYPDYDATSAPSRQTWIKGMALTSPASNGGKILSTEKMLGHGADLVDLIKELNNSDTVGGHFVDVLKSPYSERFNPAVGKFNFLKSKLMSEANTLAVGGVPHASELKKDIENMQFTDPKSKQLGIVQEVAAMALETSQGIRAQRDNILGANSPGDSLLSDKAHNRLDKIYGAVGMSKPDIGAPASGKGYTKAAQTSTARTQADLPYQGKSATMDQIKASGTAKGWDEATAKRKWIEGGGKVVQ